MIPLFEAPTVTNSFYIPGPHLVQSCSTQRAISFPFFYYRFIIWIVTVSSRHLEFIKQIKDKNMSE